MPSPPPLFRSIEPDRFTWLDPERYATSLGVSGKGVAWLAGITAATYCADTDRIEVDEDEGRQARQCWDKVQAVLAATDLAPSDLTEIVEYVTPRALERLDDVAAARPTNRMASTFVVESLVRPDGDVVVETVAGAVGGLIRLPQILPIDEHGTVVAPGDLVGQCRWVLEQAERLLESYDLDLGDAVKIVHQTVPEIRRHYRDCIEHRNRLLGPAFPASTTVIVPRLPHPRALVALDLWASIEPKRVVPYAAGSFADLSFAPAVSCGNILYISGTAAWNPETNRSVHPGNIAAQAEFVYQQIAEMCEMAGTSIDNLVKTIEYVTPSGLAEYRDVGDVRATVLGRPFPATTAVVVSGLLHPTWEIEVEALAVIPD